MGSVHLLYTASMLLGIVQLVANQQSNVGSCLFFHVERCSVMNYNTTFEPNRLGHLYIEDAEIQFNTFQPLITAECSPALLPLLCTTFFPKCTANGDRVEPCARLCRQARDGCMPLLNNFGFPWPSSLDCSTYPDDHDCFDIESIQLQVV